MKKKENAQASKTSGQKGILGQVGEEVKQDLKTTPQEVTDALMQDAKQAVNYEIRKGFRSLINDLFKR